jgi:Glycosyl transferase family 2
VNPPAVTDAMGGVTANAGPLKVALIDVESCPESVVGSPDQVGLWSLVRERGRPRGIIRVAFEHGRLSKSQLLEAIAELPRAEWAPPLTWPADVDPPRISVVVPSLMKRSDYLRACLRSLAALDYPNYEVILVDNRPAGSAAVDPELADTISALGAHTVREPRTGNSAARNRGLDAARGGIVAFTDDDVEVDPAWLLAIALRFRAHPEEACVTGLLLPRELETSAQLRLEDYYGGVGPRTFEPVSHRLRGAGRRLRLEPATIDAVGEGGETRRSFSLYATGTLGTGPNMAIRTETLRALGGFDTALGAGTPARGGGDLLALAQIVWHGHGLGFEPAAIVHHNHYSGDADLRRQIESYGIGWGALLFALTLDDPRHLVRMAATMPRATRVLIGRFRRRLDSHQSDAVTRQLARGEIRSMAAGPAAYLRGRRRW